VKTPLLIIDLNWIVQLHIIAIIPIDIKSITIEEMLKNNSEKESVNERIGFKFECSIQHPAPIIRAKIKHGNKNAPSDRDSKLEKGIIERIKFGKSIDVTCETFSVIMGILGNLITTIEINPIIVSRTEEIIITENVHKDVFPINFASLRR
jgi:hypothetical protein